MGMFTKAQKNMATGVYADVKKCLKEKDGFTHVVMVTALQDQGRGTWGKDMEGYSTLIMYK